MSKFKEILDNIYTWSEYCEEKDIDFNGYLIFHKGEAVIIDPPELTDEEMAELKGLLDQRGDYKLKGILLTNVHHERGSEKMKKKLSIPVFIHINDQGGLECSPDNVFQDGSDLFCGLKVKNLANQKSPGESVFLLADRKILIAGDALIGRNPGQFNLLPPDKYQDIQAAKKGLKALNGLDFDAVLVGDGNSIITDAKKALEALLD